MLKTVLVVEDYVDVRAMMKTIIQHCGYNVLVATDGFEAIECARQCRPDLILMDISMPIMDGLGATKIIREFESISDVPIIALTAYGDLYYEKAINAGCNEVVDKPMNLDKLASLIASYIN